MCTHVAAAILEKTHGIIKTSLITKNIFNIVQYYNQNLSYVLIVPCVIFKVKIDQRMVKNKVPADPSSQPVTNSNLILPES